MGLAHAHERGLIHRDLKPSNLLRTADGQVKILDLGLARFLQDQIGDSTLTSAGLGMGTPDYMAPEQFHDARNADPRADIYSLGCTLYQLIAGRVPFPTSSLAEKYTAHESLEPTPLEELCPDVPAGLALAVGKMMAKRPADRFHTALEAAEALAPYVAGSSHAFAGIKATASWHGSQLGLSVKPRQKQRRTLLIAGVTAITITALLITGWSAGWFGRTNTSAGTTSGADAGSGQPPPRSPLPAEPNVLTVAKDGTGQHRSIGEALEQVTRPNMTIRVLDNAEYAESLSITLPERHKGLRIESPRRATLRLSQNASTILYINNVPGVRVSGLRLIVDQNGKAGVGVFGTSPDVVFEDVEFVGQPKYAGIGASIEGLELTDDQAPVTFQRCSLSNLGIGLRIYGQKAPSQIPWPVRNVIIRECSISQCSAGVLFSGRFERILLAGNRIWDCEISAIGLMQVLEGSGPLIIANNSIRTSANCLGLEQLNTQVSNVEVAGNVFISLVGPDLAMTGTATLDDWKIHHNWREQPPTSPQAILSTNDQIGPVPGISQETASPEFLQITADSPLATSGAGGDLPAYVGALPPLGKPAWNWETTWYSRHPPTLTVSQAESNGGRFRTLKEALANVKYPGTTIRVLDDAEYLESLQIDKRREQAGLTIESLKRATLVKPTGAHNALMISQVPGVRIKGMRVRLKDSGFGVIAGGLSPNVVLEDIDLEGQMGEMSVGVDFEAADLSRDQQPMTVRQCRFNGLIIGIQILGAQITEKTPTPIAGVCVRDCTISSCVYGLSISGRVNRVLVAENRIWDCRIAGIRLVDLYAGSGELTIVNNSILAAEHCLAIEDISSELPKVEFANNLLVATDGPDVYLTESPQTTAEFASRWQVHHNWRQLPESAGPALLASRDQVGRADLISDRSSDPRFFEPVAGSALATAGTGEDLPGYVGAVPPAGAAKWDWDKTWQALGKE